MNKTSLSDLQQRLQQFAAKRDWEQFHSPKNLSMALITEAAELVEHFQWLNQKASRNLTTEKQREVSHEMADILIFLLRLADVLNIDLITAVQEKIVINTQRYPVDKVKGDARRADEY